MFKNNQPKRRNSLHKDQRSAIEDYILEYVKRNPGKSIPSSKIGAMTGTPAYNVSTVIKQLVRLGEIKRLTKFTYEINDSPKPMVVIPELQEPYDMATDVERLAKDYAWQSDAPSLRGFIDWLKNG